jgi:hypothetical protein
MHARVQWKELGHRVGHVRQWWRRGRIVQVHVRPTATVEQRDHSVEADDLIL